MRAIQILRQFRAGLRDVHAARTRAVFSVVEALIRSGRLSLTCLGRAVAVRTSPKHGIKRVDRLLGNARLHDERLTFFRAIARKVVGRGAQPVVLVDWTAVTPQLWALVAAVPFEGRALTIYAETHPISRYCKPAVHATFLLRLKDLLPKHCKPIIVTDAGFCSPWMRRVEALGWDYVGRVRHGLLHNLTRDTWTGFGPVWGRIKLKPTDLGRFEIGARARFPCRLVGIRKWGSAPFPKSTRTGPLGSRAYDRDGARYRRIAQEPWTLATSLHGRPDEIVRIYRLRMQIEETFRDAKSGRFGVALGFARPRSPERADVLLLLASFGHLISTLVGLAAEAADLHRRFQANTVRNRRVLALPTLGRLVASTDALMVTDSLLRRAWDAFVHHLSPAPAC